jgi:hypothetical protein
MAQVFKETNYKHCVTLIPNPSFGGLTEEEKTQTQIKFTGQSIIAARTTVFAGVISTPTYFAHPNF